MNNTAQRLRRLWLESRVQQKWLADRAGTTTSTLSRWLSSDTADVPFDNVVRMLDALGVDVAAFIAGDESLHAAVPPIERDPAISAIATRFDAVDRDTQRRVLRLFDGVLALAESEQHRRPAPPKRTTTEQQRVALPAFSGDHRKADETERAGVRHVRHAGGVERKPKGKKP